MGHALSLALRKTGMYVVGERGNKSVDEYIGPMKENGIVYKIFSGAEVSMKYSGQVNFPEDYQCVYEGDSGILKAHKAVETMQVCFSFVVKALWHLMSNFQDLFVKHGGKLMDECQVTGIVPGPVVTVKTNKGDFVAKRLILTTGAWTNYLLDKAGIGLNLQIKV